MHGTSDVAAWGRAMTATRQEALLLAAAAADAAQKLERQIHALAGGTATALQLAELEHVLGLVREMAAKLAMLAENLAGERVEAGG